MIFEGISKTFSTVGEQQYKTIGAFWDEMSAKYGLENLRGLGYNWTSTTIEYVIGLKEGAIDGADCTVQLPDEGWVTVTGKTAELSQMYNEIYQDGALKYEIETFDNDGSCEVKYIRNESAKTKAKKHKKAKTIIVTCLILFALFFTYTEIMIYSYLKQYGYGFKELPQATLVYFHLSDGFTVDTNEHGSTFIGRHDYIYDEVFLWKGYFESDQMGMVVYYAEIGKDHPEGNACGFSVFCSNDWCHWFRVYELSGGRKIEDL